MYKAYITHVTNIRPAENADRLNACEVFGNTTIIDKTITEDTLILYLPSDGQISVEFGEKNNLFRRKDENGNNVGGFVDPDKRNIAAIRLRGNRSDGLVLPISCLNYCFSHGDASIEFHAGDVIDGLVNGHEIACKYVPIRRAYEGKGKSGSAKKIKADIAPLFAEHVETEQLPYNLNKFRSGDILDISLKCHGCFISGTKVRMADNSLKRIEKIKVGDKVLGYDFEKKKIIPTTVLHTFKNTPSNKWNKIKISREYIKGDKRGTQTSTWNHKYWVEEKQEWVMAKDLKVGEKISTLFPSPVLTQLQKDIAIGQFLGDGCLMSFEGRTAEIQESKKSEHKEYMDFLNDITSGWFGSFYTKTSGYGTEMIAGRTTRSADLYNYFKDCSTFDNGSTSQRLLEGIASKVSPIGIAIWYMGDGSLLHNDSQQDRASLAICRYTTAEDQRIIENIFNQYDIYPTLYIDSEGRPRIRFNLAEANKLFDLIAEFIPPCMQYKLPPAYRDKFKKPVDKEKYNPSGYVLSPQEVLENEEINEYYDEYDLETELHNYIVGLTIVHNTSQRTAYLPTEVGYERTFWDKVFKRSGKRVVEYRYICGTRRTILGESSSSWGSEDFRKAAHESFIGKLHKGETVYYEVVGYNGNMPIMPSADNKKMNDKQFVTTYGNRTEFSYSCDVGANDFYVYRMTLTLEDGYVFEYSPEQIRRRCEEMGIKTVLHFEKVQIPVDCENPGLWAQTEAEKFYDGADPIGKTHIREGVVVRIVNRTSFEAYKIKNYAFKVLSGIAIADAESNAATDNLSDDVIAEM